MDPFAPKLNFDPDVIGEIEDVTCLKAKEGQERVASAAEFLTLAHHRLPVILGGEECHWAVKARILEECGFVFAIAAKPQLCIDTVVGDFIVLLLTSNLAKHV